MHTNKTYESIDFKQIMPGKKYVCEKNSKKKINK